MPRIGRAFFARDSVSVARDLIGARLAVTVPGAPRLEGVIVETEAYEHNDQASHSYRGRTERNAAMFGKAGHAYVYFIYGMHFCLNLVTGGEGIGAAVLVRALRPTVGVETMRFNRGARQPQPDNGLCRGPGNLCRALGIDRSWDGLDVCAPRASLRIYTHAERPQVGATRRVGVTGDAAARAAPWRFFAVGDSAVSKPPSNETERH